MQKYSDICHPNMTLWTLADGVSWSSVWICLGDMTWNIPVQSDQGSLIRDRLIAARQNTTGTHIVSSYRKR